MKLFEMQKRPNRAGLAELRYGDRTFRSGKRITIPNNRELEFYPLQDGQQFLIRNGQGSRAEFWFGGTDEQPFLVQLTDIPFEAFKEKGESGFYAALKPRLVSNLERHYSTVAKRQGDIFAVPITCSWEDFDRILPAARGSDDFPCIEQQKADNQQLFGTRHRLKEHTGTFATIRRGIVKADSSMLLVEGTVTAPDHRPMVLEGPHAIVQAKNLLDPKKAD